MPPVKRRKMRHPKEYQKAAWFMARGYPPKMIAMKLGVHRNTVLKWRKKLGYAVGSDEDREVGVVVKEVRTLNYLLQRARALSPEGRKWLSQHLEAT